MEVKTDSREMALLEQNFKERAQLSVWHLQH